MSMGGRRGNDMAPRVKVIETSYITIPDPSRFKDIVQSLTGAVCDKEDKSMGKKRVPLDRHNYRKEVGDIVEDKRQRCDAGDAGALRLTKMDSFKEELHRMLVPDSPPVEDQLEWLFSDHDDTR